MKNLSQKILWEVGLASLDHNLLKTFVYALLLTSLTISQTYGVMPDNMTKLDIEVEAEGGVGVDEKLGWSVDTSISLIDEDNTLLLSKLTLAQACIIVPVYMIVHHFVVSIKSTCRSTKETRAKGRQGFYRYQF